MRSSAPDPLSFNLQVWDLTRKIPSGRVTTYGRLAAMIPAPEDVGEAEYKAAGARWVGNAMAACPDDVPWQRVINAQGTVSRRSGLGVEEGYQRHLLEEEGVVFGENGRIDLERYRWDPEERPRVRKRR